MTYHDSDTSARTIGGVEGYVADVIVVQHTSRGVLVTRADTGNRNTPQSPPRR